MTVISLYAILAWLRKGFVTDDRVYADQCETEYLQNLVKAEESGD